MTNALSEKVIVAGAGPIGIATAISAKRRGLDPLLVDAGAIVDAIVRYPPGMRFFTTPELLEIGGHPFPCAGEKPTREEALKYYRGVVRAEGLRVRTYTRLVDARRESDPLRCTFESESGPLELTTEKLVLATGYFDHPNLVGIPGEDLPHVSHYYDEGHLNYDRDVVVVGGKNSAVEAALDLFRCGARVNLVYRGPQWKPSVKYWMRPDLENRIKSGEISAHLSTELVSIEPESVRVRDRDGREKVLPARRVYLLTGYHPDFELFRRLGIRLEGETMRPAVDSETLETNVPGIHLVGSITAGTQVSEIFIENGRFDGERVFSKVSASA